jgi:hypothetical protein
VSIRLAVALASGVVEGLAGEKAAARQRLASVEGEAREHEFAPLALETSCLLARLDPESDAVAAVRLEALAREAAAKGWVAVERRCLGRSAR